MSNIEKSTDVKNISAERKGVKVAVSIFIVMVVTGIGFSFYPAQGVSVVEKQKALQTDIRTYAEQICESNKAILAIQVEGGKELNLPVENYELTLKNLENKSNCWHHVADILKGSKQVGN